MKSINRRNRLLFMTAASVCAVGAALAAETAPVEAGIDKFARLNNDAVRTVEVMPQLPSDAVARLGKKDGRSDASLRGSIRANGFLAPGKTESRNQATPEEIAEKAAQKARKGLHSSINASGFASAGRIERAHMGVDDVDAKSGSPRNQTVPNGFVKTKE